MIAPSLSERIGKMAGKKVYLPGNVDELTLIL
jgi:hypothetical protein